MKKGKLLSWIGFAMVILIFVADIITSNTSFFENQASWTIWHYVTIVVCTIAFVTGIVFMIVGKKLSKKDEHTNMHTGNNGQ